MRRDVLRVSAGGPLGLEVSAFFCGGVCTRRAADRGSACAWLCIYVDTQAKGRVSVCVNCTGVSGKEGCRY